MVSSRSVPFCARRCSVCVSSGETRFWLCHTISHHIILIAYRIVYRVSYHTINTYRSIYEHSFFRRFGQEIFFVSASVCDSRNRNSRSNRFVRAPSSGGGSNAPRPAVSVPHLDVNADGCRARQARSCKNIACRGRIPEILVVFSRLQCLDDLQNWHHFQTVGSCYCKCFEFCGSILSNVCFA